VIRLIIIAAEELAALTALSGFLTMIFVVAASMKGII
jgi:hypothetical protein